MNLIEALAALAAHAQRTTLAAIDAEERLAAQLPADRFCAGDGCRTGYAADIRAGLVGGVPEHTGHCGYCRAALEAECPHCHGVVKCDTGLCVTCGRHEMEGFL